MKKCVDFLCVGSAVLLAAIFSGVAARAQTSVYSAAGTYTSVVPAGVTAMRVKLWGAGGGNGVLASGGAGAFAQSTYSVTPGQTFVVVVGQQGAEDSIAQGGVNSGNAAGGSPGFLGDYNQRGQGGQASSVFHFTGGVYVAKAIAGAGGGAGRNGAGGAGGQAGTSYSDAVGGQPGLDGKGGAGGGNGKAGSNYSSVATSSGIASLNLSGGAGGDAANWSGGGGGGYGGGGGAGNGTVGNGAGGAGGGSYGELILNGSGTTPANTSDVNYVAGSAGPSLDGLAVVTYFTGTVQTVAMVLPPTNMTFTTVQLRGTVNPGGAPAGYYFEYGYSTNYGFISSTQQLPGLLAPLPINLTLSNLSPSLTYHCRIVATNRLGTTFSANFPFSSAARTNQFSISGTYTSTVPPQAYKVTAKLWGAGGAGGLSASGGGGGFSSVTLDVSPGDKLVLVVGQGGITNGITLGGAGSGNTPGGAPGYLGNYNDRGQGGQASSLFVLTNNTYILKAVAGGGGGAGIAGQGGGGGAAGTNYISAVGGQPGSGGTGGAGGGTAQPGSNYNPSAATTGITNLNLAGGNGGNAENWSGGGGGGYGGGGGGGSGSSGNGAGGGGGGSFGTTTTPGSAADPGAATDSAYIAGTARGGGLKSNGTDGLIALTWSVIVPVYPTTITSSLNETNGLITLALTNNPGATFNTLASTNILAPLNTWTNLGPAIEITPGRYQFTEPPNTNFPARFYLLRSP